MLTSFQIWAHNDLEITTDTNGFIHFRDRHNRCSPTAQPSLVYNACHFQMLHFPCSGILDSKWYRSRSGKTRVAIVPLQTSALLASVLCLIPCITLPHVYRAASKHQQTKSLLPEASSEEGRLSWQVEEERVS